MWAAMPKDREVSIPLLIGRLEKFVIANSRWGVPGVGL